MKRGFSLILALIFIVLVMGIGMLSMTLATTGAKTSLNIFLKEQARLLADSASEYAILKVQQNDFNTACIDKIVVNYPSDTDPAFQATLHLTYVGNADILATKANCKNVIESDNRAKADLSAIIINGQVKSNVDEGMSYSFTTTQIP